MNALAPDRSGFPRFEAARSAARLAVLRAAGACGAPAVLRGLNSRDDLCVVLAYHSVAPAPLHAARQITVAPALFHGQIAHLARHYRILPLAEAVDCLVRDAPFPQRSVAITFDDGYRDNAEHALPVLRDHDAPATVFVTSDPALCGARFWVGWLHVALGRAARLDALAPLLDGVPSGPQDAFDRLSERLNRLPRPDREALLAAVAERLGAGHGPAIIMDAETLRAMEAAGVTIGSHTRSHPVLCACPDAELDDELAGSRRALSDALGRPVDLLAYPNGRRVARNFDARVAEAARRAGYRAAFTSLRGPLRRRDDPMAIRRLGVRSEDGVAGLAMRIEMFRITRR